MQRWEYKEVFSPTIVGIEKLVKEGWRLVSMDSYKQPFAYFERAIPIEYEYETIPFQTAHFASIQVLQKKAEHGWEPVTSLEGSHLLLRRESLKKEEET